jgi:superfamily II DNA helicase RecQ
MVPKSLSNWVQQSGRAGRLGSPAIAILLVEPSVFQMQKTKEQKSTGCQNQETNTGDQVIVVGKEETNERHDSNDEDQGLEGLTLDASEDVPTENRPMLYKADTRYLKKVKGGLRNWIQPDRCDCSCRREVSRKYFNNPPSQSSMLSGN